MDLIQLFLIPLEFYKYVTSCKWDVVFTLLVPVISVTQRTTCLHLKLWIEKKFF